jgi:hypothetical protein
MAKVTLNLPAILDARDYHEFDDICRSINKIASAKVKHFEISTDYTVSVGMYCAVFYTGVKPDKKTIAKWVALDKRLTP